MSGAFDTAVSLADVLALVDAKRVPMAPELAGYLVLEVAGALGDGAGVVDPARVHVGEEGSVAVVRPRGEPVVGDPEQSLREVLGRLLAGSGAATSALHATARRAPGAGLDALVREIEAALIPVNRAAGRRAIARLSREVRRVRQGVGRNAVTSARPASQPSFGAQEAKTVPRTSPFGDEPSTTRRDSDLAPSSAKVPSSGSAGPPGADAEPPRSGPAAARAEGGAASLAPSLAESLPPDAKGPAAFARDEVEQLLATFEVEGDGDDKGHRDELSAIAGLEPTPGPAAVKAVLEAEARRSLPDGPDAAPLVTASPSDDVDALLALADEPRAPSNRPFVPSIPPDEARTEVRPDPAGARADAAAAGAGAGAGALPPPSSRSGMRWVGPAGSTAPKPPSGPALASPPPPLVTATGSAPAASVPAIPTDAPLPSGLLTGVDTGFRPPRAPRTGLALSVLALVALGFGALAVWQLSPSFFGGGKRPAPSAATAPAPTTAPAAPRCRVSLAVEGAPPGAEILLLLGKAPLDVDRMPVGTRLEFVATHDGYLPRRSVITDDATWDKAEDGRPRFELAVQLDRTSRAGEPPWPPAQPGTQVGGSGQAGTVHVVSTPRGAEVWLLAGLGPDARIDQLACDADLELLVAPATGPRARLTASRAQVEAAPADDKGTRSVTLTVAPPPTPPRGGR